MDVFLGVVAAILATFGTVVLVAARIGVVGRAPFAEIALASIAAVLAGVILACAIDSNDGNRFGDTRIQISTDRGSLYPMRGRSDQRPV